MYIKPTNPNTRATLLVLLMIALISQIASCASNTSSANQTPQATENLTKDNSLSREQIKAPTKVGEIFLFGEEHSSPWILKTEYDLWNSFYHGRNMRHLFVELAYYTAEYLNLWMQSDNDEILKQLFEDAKGTAMSSEANFAFYKKIKATCPETIFHGVDIGHQYNTTGKRYLEYLIEKGETETSERYQRTKESIEQGERYYGKMVFFLKKNHAYRENMMTENFIREYNRLDGADVMGFFGAVHTDPKGLNFRTQEVPAFANQLTQHYGDALHTTNLIATGSSAYLDTPVSVETKVVAGKTYTASYFGEVDLTETKSERLKMYRSRRYWRLENAYDDFKDNQTDTVLPYSNYPMPIEKGQVLMVEYTLKDDTIRTDYYRADGILWNDKPSTSRIVISDEGTDKAAE